VQRKDTKLTEGFCILRWQVKFYILYEDGVVGETGCQQANGFFNKYN